MMMPSFVFALPTHRREVDGIGIIVGVVGVIAPLPLPPLSRAGRRTSPRERAGRKRMRRGRRRRREEERQKEVEERRRRRYDDDKNNNNR